MAGSLDENVKSGLDAYANEQAGCYDALAHNFTQQWAELLRESDLPSAWCDTYVPWPAICEYWPSSTIDAADEVKVAHPTLHSVSDTTTEPGPTCESPKDRREQEIIESVSDGSDDNDIEIEESDMEDDADGVESLLGAAAAYLPASASLAESRNHAGPFTHTLLDYEMPIRDAAYDRDFAVAVLYQ